MAKRGKPRAFKSVAELQDGIDSYFAECEEKNFNVYRGGSAIKVSEPLTVSGLAASLSVGRRTLLDYAQGRYGDEYSRTIKKAVAVIERDKVAKAMLGLYDKTISIFDLKNNHGWADRVDADPNDENPAPVAIHVGVVDGRKPNADTSAG